MTKFVIFLSLAMLVLSGCSESEPVSDCLGKTCDDQIGCTEDSCNENTGECVHTPDDSLCGPAGQCDPEFGCVARPCDQDDDCDDFRYCNGQERCVDAECQEGSDPCDDGIECTVDDCSDEDEACENVPDDELCGAEQVCDPINGDPVTGCRDLVTCEEDQDCDDEVFCNGEESCLDGACVAGTPVICDDQVGCSVDSCSPVSDACLHLPDHDACPAGELCDPDQGGCVVVTCDNSDDCDDGYFCNGEETCDAGTCLTGSSIVCDDGIDCTFDACNEVDDQCNFRPDHDRCSPGEVCDPEQGGCVVPPCSDDEDCQDGLYCNGEEICQAGICVPGTPIDCQDGVDCTLDGCDEDDQECEFMPDHTQCGAEELCDLVEGCVSTACQDDEDCDDGLHCNGVEVCQDSTCVGGVAPDCDDSIDCTVDSCDEDSDSCENQASDALCDDGTFCNGAETCDPDAGCQSGTDPCDDGVSCTVDDCNESAGSCSNVPDHLVCDDGAYCNGEEVCDPVDGCQEGTNPCDDGVDCTDDNCDESSQACNPVANDANCDDGLYCNGAEVCDPTTDCKPGTAPDCNDGVDCTQDQCDEGNDRCDNQPNDALCDDANPCTQDTCSTLTDPSGCVYIALEDGTDCSDGNVCNGDEQCRSGMCQAGTPLICNDDNPCTDNYCDHADGCVAAPLGDGTPCPDGDLCNGDEVCDNGTCMAGEELDCDDGNQCTDDDCFALQGCVSFDNAASCNDGDDCTVMDRCVEGDCTGVVMEICGDGVDNDCDGQTDEAEDCPGGIGTFVAPYGDDGNPGTQEFPLASVNQGIQNALIIQADTNNPQDVFVAGYDEHSYYEDIEMEPGVSLWGGYSADGLWERDPATHITWLEPSWLDGIRFNRIGIGRDTVLDGFAIYGAYILGNAQTTAVTIDACSPTLSNNLMRASSTPNCNVVNIVSGANPLLANNSMDTPLCRSSNRVVMVEDASAELVSNTIEGGGGPQLFGVALYAPGTVRLTANSIRGGDAGSFIAITEVASVGVHLRGTPTAVSMEYNTIIGGTADGPTARVFGINLEECGAGSVEIVNNPMIRGGQSYPGMLGQGWAFGIRALGTCHAKIQGNQYIRGGRGSSESGYGIRCGENSLCAVDDNGVILGAEPEDPVSQYAAGIYCELNSCESITGNQLISGGASPRLRGVVTDMGSSPIIDANNIYAGSCTSFSNDGEGIGMLMIGSGSQVTNNVIFGGFCPLAIGIQQQNQISGGVAPQQLNVNGNYINGGGLENSGGTGYGVTIFGSEDSTAMPMGDYRNNIINAGYGRYRYGIWEGSQFADPRAVDFNDIVGATEAIYFDEGSHALISIGQVNALADIQTGDNISAYPDLVNEAPGGNLHLTADSPCLDQGTTQGAPDHDMDGESRPAGQGVDIGADEYQ